jgi:tetratricopeptide (TPR) repeat protein
VSIDREKILANAQRFIDRKRYDKAIAEYQRLVEGDPNDARTWLKIGDLKARMGAIEEAIRTYERVGQQYATQGFALKAIAVYKQIREIIRKQAPELADRYAYLVPRLAQIYADLGLTSDALSTFDEAAAQLQKAQRDDEAILLFQKMVELNRENPLPHLRLAEAFCRIQRVDEAVGSFGTAAEILLGMERRSDALKVVERILHFRQEPRYARLAAELHLHKGGRDNGLLALAKLQVCFQADPKNMDTLALLAQAFTAIGQEEKSLEVYKEMARIALEQREGDLYNQLLVHLRTVAPGDPQVREFRTLHPTEDASARSVRVPPAPAPPRREELESIDDEVELLEEVEPLASARPTANSEPAHEIDDVEVEFDNEEGDEIEDAQPYEEEIEDAQPFEDEDAPTLDAAEAEAKALRDAESFRRLRLHEKAVDVLYRALEFAPDSLDTRLKLLELLVEMGDREGAIEEQVNVAMLYVHLGEDETAFNLLKEVLDAAPDNAQALELLATLGREAPGARRSSRPHLGSAPDSARGVLPFEPLPSYDLEELSAAQALPGEPGQSAGPSLDDLDDPFAGPPLPSFAFGGSPERPSPPRPSLSTIDRDALEEVLEEAEFFAAQGLYEDARGILAEQLLRVPDHPLLLEQLREVEAAISGSAGSQTIERSSIGARSSAEAVFDISASLEALNELELPQEQTQLSTQVRDQDDVERVFASFQSKVASHLAEHDASTHYDLGLAYKEMGLSNEAVLEFSQAARDPQHHVRANAMIGMIHLEQGRLDAAIEAYLSALEAAEIEEDQRVALHYDLGVVYEMKGQAADALYHLRKVSTLQPGFRGVAERLRALEGGEVSAASSRRMVEMGGDTLDDAFNDLLDSSR